MFEEELPFEIGSFLTVFTINLRHASHEYLPNFLICLYNLVPQTIQFTGLLNKFFDDVDNNDVLSLSLVSQISLILLIILLELRFTENNDDVDVEDDGSSLEVIDTDVVVVDVNDEVGVVNCEQFKYDCNFDCLNMTFDNDAVALLSNSCFLSTDI